MSAVRLDVCGDGRSLRIEMGQSILEAAMAQGLDLDHACGGVCACSTCHVKLERAGDWFSEPSEEEPDPPAAARACSPS